MLCMGRELALVLKSRREIAPPHRAGMLYDEDGDDWPACSLLVCRFDDGARKVDEGKNYFGRKARVFEGSVELPPRALSSWKRVGELEEIFYDRAGTKFPGFFRHVFNKPRGLFRLVFWIKGKAAKTPAVLYRRAKMFRIELPLGCIVDDRGIVLP